MQGPLAQQPLAQPINAAGRGAPANSYAPRAVADGPAGQQGGRSADVAVARLHQRLFGEMLKLPDSNALHQFVVPANANREEDVLRIVNAPTIIGLARKIRVVEPQMWQLTSNAGRPEILSAGTHFLASFRHDYEEAVDKGRAYVSFRGLHIIQIPDGYVGRAWVGPRPILLGAGRHAYLDGRLVFKENDNVALNTPMIQHGPINVVTVPQGYLGFGNDGRSAEPIVMEQGIHVITDPAFKFERLIDLNQQLNQIGALQLIRIETGFSGISYRNGGHLDILSPGLHLICPPDRFQGHISTQQQVIELPVAVHESADYVPLQVKADVFFRIVDPYRCVSTIGDIHKSIKETAIATLASIIRSSTLADIASSSMPSYAAKEGVADDPSAPPDSGAGAAQPFYVHIHDVFLSTQGEHMRKDWGIALENIRIESLKIADLELAKQIGDQAKVYAQTQARLSNLASQTQIMLTETERDAKVTIQQSEARKAAAALDAEARKIATELNAKAQATRILATAKAEADALRLTAQAEADGIRLRAAAEKERLRLEGEGNRVYMAKLEETKTGAQLAKIREMAKAFGRTEKIFFTGKNMPPFFSSGVFAPDSQQPRG